MSAHCFTVIQQKHRRQKWLCLPDLSIHQSVINLIQRMVPRIKKKIIIITLREVGKLAGEKKTFWKIPRFHLLGPCLIQSLREIHQIVCEVLLGLSPSTITICYHVSHSIPQIMTYTESVPVLQNNLETLFKPDSHLHSKQYITLGTTKPSFLWDAAWKELGVAYNGLYYTAT